MNPSCDSRPPMDPALQRAVTTAESSWNKIAPWNLPPKLLLYMPPALVEVQLEPQLWEHFDNRPVPVMDLIKKQWPAVRAELAAKLEDGTPPGGHTPQFPPQALTMIFEVWGLQFHDDLEPSKIAEYVEIAQAGLIHAHPERTETRVTVCVDMHGNVLRVARHKGHDEPLTERPMTGISPEEHGLQELLAVMQQPV